MARGEHRFQLRAPVSGPGDDIACEAVLYGDRRGGELGLALICCEGEAGGQAVGVAIARIQSPPGNSQVMNQFVEIDNRSTVADDELVFDADERTWCGAPWSTEQLSER